MNSELDVCWAVALTLSDTPSPTIVAYMEAVLTGADWNFSVVFTGITVATVKADLCVLCVYWQFVCGWKTICLRFSADCLQAFLMFRF